MNLFNRAVNVLFAIYIIFIGVNRVDHSVDVQTQNHIRHKRVFNGTDITDDQFQYVVFVKSLPSNLFNKSRRNAKCIERLCTGTLVHARFVLTLLSCVVSAQKDLVIHPNNIRIYLKYRPYDRSKDDMSYKTGLKIISKPQKEPLDLYTENVALVLISDAFSEVIAYPKVMDVDLFDDKKPSYLSCSTVGFSLVGRNLSHPVSARIKPATYNLNVTFDFYSCKFYHEQSNMKGAEKTVPYVCSKNGEKAANAKLCEHGDEGSPLLCKPPVRAETNRSNPIVRRQKPEQSTPTGDGLVVYGLASVVPKCLAAYIDVGWAAPQKVYFSNMFMYGPWINQELADYDNAPPTNSVTVDEAVTSTTELTTPSQQTTTVTEEPTVVTQLPDYYDTGDYDVVRKRPIRCKGTEGRNRVPAAHGSRVIVVIEPDARGGHWPPFTAAAVARPPPLSRVATVLWCATAALFRPNVRPDQTSL